MNHITLSTLILLGLAAGTTSTRAADKPTPAEVKAITQKVADWQIDTFDKQLPYRGVPKKVQIEFALKEKNPGHKLSKFAASFLSNYHDLEWQCGVLYVGMNEWRKIADDPKRYTDWLAMIGRRNDWKLHERTYHADDHTVGQFYLSFYEDFQDPAMLAPTKERFDWILNHPKKGSLEWTDFGKDKDKTDCHNRWGWCDALFMAPPVWARLAKVTGDRRYLDFMDEEYHATYDLLWDKEERLFWRDSSFFEKREENGKKLFWARGNGWVFGGLALMIPDLPNDWKGRAFYIDLFKTMAARLIEIQRTDGTWSMGLLGGEEGYPLEETSGTAFFTFGMAWGVNNGILDRATYEPIILKAWNALTECVTDEGLLGYVQPVGKSPGDLRPDKTEVYGGGAFLAAGTEVYKMLGGEPNPAKPALSAVSPEPQTFARFVPERKDDFAWENDLVAFRAYGPALRDGAENSGIDCWLKRVPYPIINKWYAGAEKGIPYHEDHGEGLDNYHVGSSAGCGGTGIWLEGKREPLETFVKHELLESKPGRTRFKLTYEREIGGIVYGEEKTITIEPGQRLFSVDSVFTKDGKPAANLPVCIGVTTHDGKAKPFHNKDAGWIAAWEELDDSELGTAARMNPARIDEIKVVDSKDKDASHIFILTRTDARGALSYQAGYGWKKAGAITTREEWEAYLTDRPALP